MKGCYIALDIGAGRGTKIGVFNTDREQISETLMPLHKYDKDFINFKMMPSVISITHTTLLHETFQLLSPV